MLKACRNRGRNSRAEAYRFVPHSDLGLRISDFDRAKLSNGMNG